MRMYDLIEKKKQNQELTKEEIQYIIGGFTNGVIPDYQMSAFLMAVYFNGMTMEETVNMTMAMAHSGDLLDLSSIHGTIVDKHSTGGVGDKTSLIIGPMLASLKVPVAKMSGRGLGHTGGTIDKLESFHGFKTTLEEQEFIANVNEISFSLVGQTANLAPADKKIYALRDVTATVNQMSLIASSIMSKKIASGANVIVLDVKTGSGAFMETKEDAVKLAKMMVQIGEMVGRKTIAVISDMNEPLGHAVGNAIEVKEAIDVLSGKGEERLTTLSLELAAWMLIGVGKAVHREEAIAMLQKTIDDGSAKEKLAQFVERQGGDQKEVFEPNLLPCAQYKKEIYFEKEGYLSSCITKEVGMASLILGGGRENKESIIDLGVGIYIQKKLGDYVRVGEEFATIYGNDLEKIEQAKQRFQNAYTISLEKPQTRPVVLDVIS